MPIHETSFRIGCGRYIQERGALASVGAEVMRLGTSPLIVGGETALKLTREKLEKSVSEVCEKHEIVVHTGTCNEERAKELAALAKEKGYDVIVGVGGGVIMDFSKLCAYFAQLPTINVPTSSATCAAYTPLSVRYTPEGNTIGSRHYPYEVDAVICDPEVIVTQPVRLLLSGVLDALAKFVEIRHRYRGEPDADIPLGLDYAYQLATYSYRLLMETTEQCIRDMEAGEITPALEKLIFTTIAATGVVSGIARGSNQSALGHKFYEYTRVLYYEEARPYLHGEIVGVGLLLQNAFNDEHASNEPLVALMKAHGMPSKISDVGVPTTEEAFERYYQMLCRSSSIHKDDAEECARLRKAMEYFWALG